MNGENGDGRGGFRLTIRLEENCSSENASRVKPFCKSDDEMLSDELLAYCARVRLIGRRAESEEITVP